MELTPTSLILKVSVGKGTNFATGLFSGVSPYVVVTGGKYRVQTRVVKGEANPEWNQDYIFVLENPTQAQLKIDVMTRSHLGDKFLGSATIGLQGLVMGSPQDFSFPMLRGGKKEKAAISINLMSLNMTVPGTIQSFVPVAEPTIAGGGGATEVQQYVPVAPVMEHHQSSLPPPLPPQSYAPQYEQPHPHAQQPQQPQQPQPQQQFLQQQPSYVSYAPHSETTQGMYAGHGVATAGGPGYQPLYGGPAAGPSVAPMASMAPMAPVVPATNPYAK